MIPYKVCILKLIFCICFISLAHAQTPDISSGLVAQWNFDKDDFLTAQNSTYFPIQFRDVSGNGNIADCQSAFALNNTIYNQCPTLAVGPDGSPAAQFVGAILCDNKAQYLGVKRNALLNTLSQGSVALWIAPDSMAPDQAYRILDTRRIGTPHSWEFHRDGDPYFTLTVVGDNGSELDALTFPGGGVQSKSWHHYGFTWGAGQLRGYFDGVPFGTFAMADVSSLDLTNYLAIGALMHGDVRNSPDGGNCVRQYGGIPGQLYVFPNAGFYSGRLDDIRIYNRALSDVEMTTLAAQTTTPSGLRVLRVRKTNSGSGIVTGGGASIGQMSCGKHCAEAYSPGTLITLTALPDLDSLPGVFSGACSGTGSCSVKMDENRDIVVDFPLKYPVVHTIPASEGILSTPFQLGGGALYSRQDGAIGPPYVGGTAVFAFDIIQPGEYIVAAEVNAPSQSANSFFVTVDSAEVSDANSWHIKTTAAYQKRFVSWGGNFDGINNPVKSFTLAAGRHELRVWARESFTYLKSVHIEGPTSTTNKPAPRPPLNLGIFYNR